MEEEMALREIRQLGDEILSKTSREVKRMTPHIEEIIDDMLDTMYDKDGVGLAACQVGVLRRIVVIDVGEDYLDEALVMINPTILETEGEQSGDEGCLSYPGMAGTVTRPNYVKAAYLDRDMNECVIEGEELLARAICHEIDHLDGHMYTEFVEGDIHEAQYAEDEEEDEEGGNRQRRRRRKKAKANKA